MKSYDSLAQDLVELYSRAHPEMTLDEVQRYVIGVLSPIGHVIYTAQMEAGEVPESFSNGPKGYTLSKEGKATAEDVVWHPMHRCWVKIRSFQVSLPRKDFIGIAINGHTVVIEAFNKQFNEGWTVEQKLEDNKVTFVSDGKKLTAWIWQGKLLTKAE